MLTRITQRVLVYLFEALWDSREMLSSVTLSGRQMEGDHCLENARARVFSTCVPQVERQRGCKADAECADTVHLPRWGWGPSCCLQSMAAVQTIAAVLAAFSARLVSVLISHNLISPHVWQTLI